MSLAVFDPFADLTRLRHQVDRLFEETGGTAAPQARVMRVPADVIEGDASIQVVLDVPGLDRDTLDVQLAGDELVVRGERKWVRPESGGLVHSERPYGVFQRSFRIGAPLQQDSVTANYTDGVLTVVLPKAEAVRPRKVAIQTSGA